MSTKHNEQLPYYALVGCNSKPTWGETAIGYATFYHQIHQGVHFNDAANAMRTASGNNTFYIEHAESSRKAYVEEIKKVSTVLAQRPLADLMQERGLLGQFAPN